MEIRWRSTSVKRTVMIISVLALMWIFVGEFGIFYVYSMNWKWPLSQLQLGSSNGELVAAARLRILLLSDPHIQCTFNRYESWLSRWDADQYVKKAFSLLISTLQPEMVVVLGDLFAEGFKASFQEWDDYLQCLKTVLPIPSNIKFLALPGDNDIGGEGSDSMEERVNRRYISQFGKMNSAFTYKGVMFIKLNTVSHIHHRPLNNIEIQARQQLYNFIASMKQNLSASQEPIISFSHVPLNELHNPILKFKILFSLHPDFIFSGHVHHAMYTTHSYAKGRVAKEFTLPTCSYRMGQARMGVGAAVVGVNDSLAYEVLWLPGRYPFLISYAVLCAMLAFTIVCSITRRPRNWCRRCKVLHVIIHEHLSSMNIHHP